MLDKIQELRREVDRYLRLYLSEKDKYSKRSKETKVFLKMRHLRKSLDKAIAHLKMDKELIQTSPLTTTLSPKPKSVVTPNKLSKNTTPGVKKGSNIPKPDKINSSISASVGNKGKNTSEDTKVVQSLLNNIGAKLNVDGECGKATILAIRTFQSDVLGFSKSDGRVDPDGYTLKGLLAEGIPEDNTPPTIKYSVGNKGKNNKKDVKVIQKLLNDNGAKLTVDGICGKGTIRAVKSFQKNKLANPRPDGRVDVNGKTWKALLTKVEVPDSSNVELIKTEKKSNNRTDNTKKSVDNPIEESENTSDDNAVNIKNVTEHNLDKETEQSTSSDKNNWKYFSHNDWNQTKIRLGSGRTAKPLNEDAEKLLKNILAGAGLRSARVTSTLRTFSDQAYIVLTQVTQEEVNKWYSWIRKNRNVYDKYAKQLKDGVDKEKVFNEYGEWIKKNVGLAASNHLSGIALDIAGCDLEKFNKFASTLVTVSGSGVKKVFPEYKRTHVEFTFKVC